MRKVLRKLRLIAITNFTALLFASIVVGQSTDQNFPTPVHQNEISGIIKARDIGDSRLTSHFYTFEGGQGDLFINVQSANFAGDVDVFVIPGLRPLTKMVMYADSSSSETGRVVYLRKPETILLRIQGRTPGDEEASYRIKFAGSFFASKAQDNVPDAPKVDTETQTSVRVNSVGTIVEVIPKATPAQTEEPEPEVDEVASDTVRKVEEKKNAVTANENKEVPADEIPLKQKVVITDPLAEKAERATAKDEPSKPAAGRNTRSRVKRPSEAEARKDEDAKAAEQELSKDKEEPAADVEAVAEKEAPSPKETNTERSKSIDPMEGIRLVIRFKNGSVIERPMTEVSKFTVERAVLTVINKNGAIGRYPMIEVAGVTIE